VQHQVNGWTLEVLRNRHNLIGTSQSLILSRQEVDEPQAWIVLAVGNTSALHTHGHYHRRRAASDCRKMVPLMSPAMTLLSNRVTPVGALYALLLAGNTAIGGKMDQLVVSRNQRNACRFHRRAVMRLLVALICCGLTVGAQNSTQQTASKPFSIRTTHLVGFENAKSNCSGTLSIQDDSLQFQQTGKTSAHNLARNIAKTLKESFWPGVDQPAATITGQL
jgi:hypothetical protein